MKQADLNPDVQLQPHQEHIRELAADHPLHMLLMHGLGSGKSLSALAAAEAQKSPYTVVAPASLRATWKKEIERFVNLPSKPEILSYSQVARGKMPAQLGSLIVDEAQNLRNADAERTKAVSRLSNQAHQLLLLSGTPATNAASELAPTVSMLTGKEISPQDFEKRYVGEREVGPGLLGRIMGVTPGTEPEVQHADELKALLKGHVDYYQPEKSTVPVNYQNVETEMTPEQSDLYQGMYNRLPFWARYKLKHNYALTRDELRRMMSFFVGPRQAGLSVLPFMKNKNPYKAFQTSGKLQKAFELLKEELVDPRRKAIVHSNFIQAGLIPYAAALEREGIPHAIFHGGLDDAQRKKLIDDFNANKLRVALVGPSGAEGISLRGSTLTQLLDQHFNSARLNQATGRGLRFDSHTNLPEELKTMKVQKFISKLPLGLMDRLLSLAGFDRNDNRRATDDYLAAMSARKDRELGVFMNLLKEVGGGKKAEIKSSAGNLIKKVGEDKKAEVKSSVGNLIKEVGEDKKAEVKSSVGNLIKEVGEDKKAEVKSSAGNLIKLLQKAKEYSDARIWAGKDSVLLPMLRDHPADWEISENKPDSNVIGIRHRKTGWQFHMPRTVAGYLQQVRG